MGMIMEKKLLRGGVPRVVAALISLTGGFAQAQSVSDPGQLEAVVVTGSRITQAGAGAQPVSIIDRDIIEKTGLQSLGDLLQQLTTGGSALNTKFNSSGNFGYPPDGGGIGAGSSEVALRNLDSKRTLVLVDGVRVAAVALRDRRCRGHCGVLRDG